MNYNPRGIEKVYSRSSTCAANTSYCTGTGCSGGYCSIPKTSCQNECTVIYGTSNCVPDTTVCTGAGCIDGFCTTSRTGCNTNCSRLAIAKRALFNILDNDGNNIINSADSDSLGVRIGYMRFVNIGDGQKGNDTGNDYTRGSIKLITKISELGADTGTSYSLTYCGNSSTCARAVPTCASGECIVGAAASGGTPLASSLKEVKKYLDDHKARDSAKACRQKFVLLISDGADTFACGGGGSECQEHMYQRRREVVAAAKALNNAGYKVFVIGFGSEMEDHLRNTLNWAAYHGGTDNPFMANDGNITAYSIPSIPSGATFPSGISSCSASTTDATTCVGYYIDGSTFTKDKFKAQNNDPGYLNLSGYAFLAGDSDSLTSALNSAINTIRSSTYSFTQASVQAIRTVDENYIYEASFEPVSDDPFWIGHLKRFSIDQYGNIAESADWDAGSMLQSRTANSRNILTIDPTVTTGIMKTFTAANITNTNLGVSTDAERMEIINFVRGGELDASHPFYGWKLGDIFHTSPLSIATPNANFFDRNDTSGTAWTVFRDANLREVGNGGRIILVGANDGQLHAFKALNGEESWSFVPPNLISKLKNIAHSTHPTSLEHTYFVDGPLSAAEVWLGTGTIGSTNKSAAGSWKTYLIVGQGRGGIPTLWSQSNDCQSNFSPYYKVTTIDPDTEASVTATYGHYCGYYALDITSTSADPVFQWRLGGNSALSADVAAYLGQSWSKMFLGRVRINNTEKWVGLIGGGYSGTNCASAATCDSRGKGFIVVDLNDGTILWKYTHADNANMKYDLAAAPVAVDYDGDGFLDTAYIGDTGGNVWRFNFCLSKDGESCDTNSWSGGMLFSNATPVAGNKAIYTQPAVTVDGNYNLWVYVGTGNKTDPTGNSGTERLLGIKDIDRETTLTLGDLTDISSATYTNAASGHGWYITLSPTTGEKILAEAVAHDRKLYFTSYVPFSSGGDPCNKAGTAKLYIIDYITGAGLFGEGVRSQTIGTGIPSTPVISRNPYTKLNDLYVARSESDDDSHTEKINDPSPVFTPRKSMIYWQDMRIQ
jgi:hypothetical protein